jgi:hypothetical protein
MTTISSSPFAIWSEWFRLLLASIHKEAADSAFRLRKTTGTSTNYLLIFAKTDGSGTESGGILAIERGESTEVSTGVHGVVAFLRQLPESVRQEIIKGIDL